MFIIIIFFNLFFFSNYFLIFNRLNLLFLNLFNLIKNIFQLNQNSWKIYFLIIFWLVFFINFSRLAPFIFSFSCLPIFCLSLGFIFWLIFFLLNYINNPKKRFSHLVPEGCPSYLISFIVFIELIRLIIRPLTLRVRLIANITAGHLLLFLVRIFFIPSFLIIILELVVRLIQAFVFSLLLRLYLNERN